MSRDPKFPPAERERKVAALLEIVERARTLNDLDFELRKKDLAKEFEQFNRRHVLQDAIRDRLGDAAVLDRKIEHYFAPFRKSNATGKSSGNTKILRLLHFLIPYPTSSYIPRTGIGRDDRSYA